mmetsp:Transcript_35589/g.85693  ORF Transcript_35589/g.85693 Transcript_35589/m.85693 type:complete len:236 (+) Transcript_35589:75-782(+)
MKINFSNPATGQCKQVEFEDNQVAPFYDQRMAAVVPGDSLGEEYAGCLFKITGGRDKQGFPMMQGVLTNQRVRLLLNKNHKCYRERRKGIRKRKSIRGCVVSSEINVLMMALVKKGDKEIEGLTDDPRPRSLGPKRATKIRKMFGLSKEDDVRKFVVKRVKKNGKNWLCPKIQRLVTDRRLARKAKHIEKHNQRRMKRDAAMAAYTEKVAEWRQELKQKRAEEVAKKKKKVKKAA